MQKPQPNHLFYMNAKENSVKPPWYINCGRKEAEDILRKHREYGNVLLRPNSNFAINGSYALSAVTNSNGEEKFVHYVISRATNGFKLEVQSKPAPMACLKHVLDYYISAAGCQTHHAMVLDPTDTCKSNVKDLSHGPVASTQGVYVNVNDSNTGLRTSSPPVEDPTYVTMTGNSSKKSHAIPRRCSAPTKKVSSTPGVSKDYVNMPKGAYPSVSDLYINQRELDLDTPKARDYINVANVVPGRTSGSSRRSLPKANSFPVSRKEDDDDDDDEYDSPPYLVPQPPSFSEDIRPSRIHEASGY